MGNVSLQIVHQGAGGMSDTGLGLTRSPNVSFTDLLASMLMCSDRYVLWRECFKDEKYEEATTSSGNRCEARFTHFHGAVVAAITS